MMDSTKQKETPGLGLGVLKLSADELLHLKKLVKPLKGVRKERAILIYPMYGEGGINIVNHFSNKRVPNQWPDFLSDAREVNDPGDPSYAYFKVLAQSFKLNEPVDGVDILLTVMQVRAESGMVELGKDCTNAAVDDFGKVYLYEKTTDEEDDSVYTPVIIKQIK